MADDLQGDRGKEGEVHNTFLESENITVEHGVESEQIDEGEPRVGMTFTDLEEVYVFYKAYAKSKGFGITKRGAKKDALTREHRWMTYTCCKSRQHKPKGINILSQRPSEKVDCKARICCARIEGLWMITKVNLEHNHEVSPTIARFIRQHREVDVHSKRQLEVNDMASLRPCDNVKTVIFQAGGHEELTCLNVDLTNHVNKVRRLQLNGGDAEAIHQMFGKMQTESRDFVYLMKPDKEGRLKHVFWADGRCRSAYQEFYDVITFDTIYLVNKYQMPFASFIGVNHHGHSILLGCALLNNEKTKTYKWLFESWLSCMGGNHPNGIITDQCGAIGEAIKTVFPNTRHRWCLWHIINKHPKKFARNSQYWALKDAFMEVIYDTLSVEEFEEKWASMLFEFQLESNDWLATLFENRQRWAPVYVNSFFWAGMSSTQRSESMHSFFDGYVHSRTTLRQFVEQYQLAVQDKVEKEMQENFLTLNSQILCVTHFKFEVQLRNAYTNNIFRQVQKNLTDIMYCDIKVIAEEGSNIMCEVMEIVKSESEKNNCKRFVVKFNANDHIINCNCKLFEFKGILCSHIFKVLASNNVGLIPERYILSRWRKDIVRCHSTKKISKSNCTIAFRRTKELENAFYSSVQKVIEDKSKFEHLLGVLKDQIRLLENWTPSGPTIPGQHVGINRRADASDDEAANHGSNIRYKDPTSVKRRGRPRTKRYMSSIERGTRRRALSMRQTPLMTPDALQPNTRPSATVHCQQPTTRSSVTGLLQQANEGRLQQPSSSSLWPWSANKPNIANDSSEGAEQAGRSAHLFSGNYHLWAGYGTGYDMLSNTHWIIPGSNMQHPPLILNPWQVGWNPEVTHHQGLYG